MEPFGEYLFTGKGGKAFTWVFFGVMGVVFVANLAAYVSGGSEILAALERCSEPWGGILFYAAAAAVAAFGLKVLGVAEKWAVGAMAVLFVLVSGGLPGRVVQGRFRPRERRSRPGSGRGQAPGPLRHGHVLFRGILLGSPGRPGPGGPAGPDTPGRGRGPGGQFRPDTPGDDPVPAPVPGAHHHRHRGLGPGPGALGGARGDGLRIAGHADQLLVHLPRPVLHDPGTPGLGQFPRLAPLATVPTPVLPLAGLGGFLEFMRTAGGAIAVLCGRPLRARLPAGTGPGPGRERRRS
ncbi:MAG: hypothetical protein MZU95_15750 [Desulfomicrobium escambiense]|nr:hypothetical protein [Desulfomicrobium escambiense]